MLLKYTRAMALVLNIFIKTAEYKTAYKKPLFLLLVHIMWTGKKNVNPHFTPATVGQQFPFSSQNKTFIQMFKINCITLHIKQRLLTVQTCPALFSGSLIRDLLGVSA